MEDLSGSSISLLNTTIKTEVNDSTEYKDSYSCSSTSLSAFNLIPELKSENTEFTLKSEAIDVSTTMDSLYPLLSQDTSLQDIEHIEKLENFTNSFMGNNMKENNEVSSCIPSSSFHVNTMSIPSIPKEQQEEGLHGLGIYAYDQTLFENEIMGQVDKAIKEEEEKRRKKDVERELKAVVDDIRCVKQRLSHIDKALSMAPDNQDLMTKEAKREVNAIKKEQENKIKQLKKLDAKHRTLKACITGDVETLEKALNENSEGNDDMDEETEFHLKQIFASKETQEEQMIRTGQMTPFGTVLAQQGQNQNNVKRHTIHLPQNELTDFEKYLLKEAESHQSKKAAKPHISKTTALNIKSKSKSSGETVFPKPRTDVTSGNKDSSANNTTLISPLLPKHRKKSKQKIKIGSKFATGMKIKQNASRSLIENYRSDEEISDYENEIIDTDDCISEKDDEYIPLESFSEGSESDHYAKKKKRFQKKNAGYQTPTKQKGYESEDSSDSDSKPQKSPRKRYKKVIDDGCQKSYIKRIKLYEKEKLQEKHQRIMESEDGIIDSDSESCTEFEGGFRVPNTIWNRLYRYQQTGVRWLWELHQQNCGGIIGDEMGLGKTIQVIAFLVGLKSSNLLTDGDHFQGLGPVILVCPTTVMHQWVKEFHSWWPPFRVAVLHESGSHTGSKESLVHTVNKYHGVLVTSYVGVVIHQKYLLDHDWHYVVLDEGHKIRNPDAQATLVVKQFRTPHRIILSGSPIQNNLKELWSLLDFVFPGKLGTLPVFMQQFSVPICQGGYANASQVQVQTAYKCATVLRNTIKPYLLRRMKDDVKMNIQLPNKSEQVLFCQLTEEQRQLYKDYIESPEIAGIINGSLQIFVGLINLRKICNHPDIYSGGPKIFKDTDVSTLSEDMHYGYYKRSGKMIVVEALLRLWHKQGHRVLLFTQSRQMMEILQHFVESRNYTYMKMDGSTPISSRQPAIAKFNSDATIFVFLLTTRVGGIGVNLTGANRVILYDPDWNPSTDAQARERAWRIGQEKQVTIYRLLTSGTIEEKIYHRQIFKQFVTNRVLKDPRQRRFFKSNDLYELFTLGDMGTQGTETSVIFAGTGSEIKPVKQTKDNKRKNKSQKNKKGFWTSPPKNQINESSFSEEKMENMRNLAKRLSLELVKKKLGNSNVNNSELNVKTENKSLDINNTSDINNTPVLPTEATQDVIDKKESVEHFSDTKKTLESKPKTPVKRKTSVKQHKWKKSRTVDVEGEKIEYLVKKDVFKTSQENDDLQSKQDDYVLSKLFKNSGVHTALKHDVIVDSSNPDYMLVEGEANRVAHEAVKALKKSRRQCSRAESGIPTWTGSNGGSGGLPIMKQRFGQKKKAPVTEEVNSMLSTPPLPPSATTTTDDSQPGPSGISPKKFGTFNKKKMVNEDSNTPSAILSSSDLLAAIKERNKSFVTKESSTSSDEEQHSVTATKEPATEYDELLVEIRNFVAFQASVDGQATTKEILDQFRDKLAQHQTAVFKSLISKICNFYRRTTGEGVWQLKPEFQ